MSETTLTKDVVRHLRDLAEQADSCGHGLHVTPQQMLALCDAAERAETLEARLTEVTRERNGLLDLNRTHVGIIAGAVKEIDAAEAAFAPLRAVVGEASIVACDACGRELGSAPTIPPCPECIGFKRAKRACIG